MKTTNLVDSLNNPVEDENTVKMTIDPEGMDFIMERLTNLYSQPELAALREYLSNALDSHVKAGVTVPVKVILPYASPFAPGGRLPDDLVIQDFGVGLSKDEILNIYSRYGASTKRKNNKEMGGFGLGAKSALAVTNNFTLVAVKDGLKTVANIGKSGSGAAYVNVKSCEPTAESNGVTVTIPVSFNKIISVFRFDNLFNSQIFAGVASNQVEVVLSNDTKTALKFSNVFDDNFQPINTGFGVAGWLGEPKYGTGASIKSPSLFAVVGNVVYQVKLDGLEGDILNLQKLDKLQHDVFLNLPIGSVNLTPSREELIYDDKTANALNVVASSAVDVITSIFKDKIASSKTRKEAVIAVDSAIKNNFWGKENFVWQGEKVPQHVKLGSDFGRITRKVGKAVDEMALVKPEMLATLWYQTRRTVIKVEADSSYAAVSAEVRKVILQFAKNEPTGKTEGHTIWIQREENNDPWLVANCDYVTVDEIKEKAKLIRAAAREVTKAANAKNAAEGIVTTPTVKSSNLYYVLDCDTFKMEANRWFTLTGQDVSELNPADVLYLHPQDTRHSSLKRCVPSSSPVTPARVYSGEVFSSLSKLLPGKKIVFLKTSQSVDKLATILGVDAIDVPEVYGVIRPLIVNKIMDNVDALTHNKTSSIIFSNAQLQSTLHVLSQLSPNQRKTLPEPLQEVVPFLQKVEDTKVLEAAALSSIWTISGTDSIVNKSTATVNKLVKNVEKFPLMAHMPVFTVKKIELDHMLSYLQNVPEATKQS